MLLGLAWTPKTVEQLSTMGWNHDQSEDTTNETSLEMDQMQRELGLRTVVGEDSSLA
jgi:hypothetical protein